MVDLIDKQSVVDIVMCYCPDDDGCCSKAFDDIRELLDEIENLPAVNHWIPCSEGLPEIFESVLILYLDFISKQVHLAVTMILKLLQR